MDGVRRSRYRLLLILLISAGVVAGVITIAIAGRDSYADTNGATAGAQFHLKRMPTASDPEDELIEWAELVLAGQCMAAHGFEFTVDWVVDRSKPDFVLLPYGTSDVAIAEKFGYGIGPGHRGSLSAPHVDPNRSYVASLSKARQRAYSEAFFGDGSAKVSVTSADGSVTSTGNKGCLADARRTLFGDLERWIQLDVLASNVDSQLIPRVLADQRYLAALDHWRSCMRDLGHAANDPDASRSTIMELYQSKPFDQAWPAEQATAMADAQCVGRSALTTVAERLHYEHANELFAKQATDFRDYKTLRAQAIRHARSMLSTLAPTSGPSSTKGESP